MSEKKDPPAWWDQTPEYEPAPKGGPGRRFRHEGKNARGWTGWNSYRQKALGIVGIVSSKEARSEAADIDLFHGASGRVDQLVHDIASNPGKPKHAVVLIRELIQQAESEIATLMALKGSFDHAVLDSWSFLYQFAWVAFDFIKEQGWPVGRIVFPEPLDGKTTAFIVRFLPKFSNLAGAKFRSSDELKVLVAGKFDSLTTIIPAREQSTLSLAAQLERLEKFVNNDPRLTTVDTKIGQSEGSYRKQRRLEFDDRPGVLANVMRKAYERGYFTREMIPAMSQRPDLLSAALKVRKIETAMGEDIRKYIPQEQAQEE